MDFYPLFKKIAFKCDPEWVHDITIKGAALAPFISSLYKFPDDKRYHQKILSNIWSFPIGLAAGLDKNASALEFFSQLNFGAIEVGTVTPRPQAGNPRPRMFRYPDKESLRNSLGFNNLGMDEVYKNIVSQSQTKVLGVNIGKNKATKEAQALDDYVVLYEKFCDIANYLVVNISSPNTKGLRNLQSVDFLRELSQELFKKEKKVPLLVKLSPDLKDHEMEKIIKACMEFNFDGIILTNTTIMPELGIGGVSGGMLKKRASKKRNFALSVVSNLKDFEVIGVGGIDHFDDLVEFWKNGGRVVQIYTSFIYRGPGLLISLKKQIDHLMSYHGIKDLNQLISAYRSKQLK